jgi:rubrerythrin
MSVFSKLGDAMSDANRNINQKTKNMSEQSNLKRKIAYEEERIVEIYEEIGRNYYKNPQETAILKELTDDIDTRKRRIKRMKFELQAKKGFKMCIKCQAEVDEKFSFCPVCGAKLPSGDEDFE